MQVYGVGWGGAFPRVPERRVPVLQITAGRVQFRKLGPFLGRRLHKLLSIAVNLRGGPRYFWIVWGFNALYRKPFSLPA